MWQSCVHGECVVHAWWARHACMVSVSCMHGGPGMQKAVDDCSLSWLIIVVCAFAWQRVACIPTLVAFHTSRQVISPDSAVGSHFPDPDPHTFIPHLHSTLSCQVISPDSSVGSHFLDPDPHTFIPHLHSTLSARSSAPTLLSAPTFLTTRTRSNCSLEGGCCARWACRGRPLWPYRPPPQGTHRHPPLAGGNGAGRREAGG